MSHPKSFYCFTHRNISEGKGIEIAVVLSYMGEKKWQEEENAHQYHNKLLYVYVRETGILQGRRDKSRIRVKGDLHFLLFCLNFYGVLYYFHDLEVKQNVDC